MQWLHIVFFKIQLALTGELLVRILNLNLRWLFIQVCCVQLLLCVDKNIHVCVFSSQASEEHAVQHYSSQSRKLGGSLGKPDF